MRRSVARARTKKGNIIKAIAFEGIYGKEEIEQYLSLPKEEFEEIFNKLIQDNDVYLLREGIYHVEKELWKKWKQYTPKPNNKIIDQFKKDGGTDDIQNKHIFLDSEELYKAIFNLIQNAKEKIVIVNPFIQLLDPIRFCGLLSKKKELDIKIITRKHTNNYEMDECLQYLEKKDVNIYYNYSLHGKVLVVDDKIAVVSSLNFTPNSAFGFNWEAGIITYDESVIEKIIESIDNIYIDEIGASATSMIENSARARSFV